jgi:hypothetical protein
VPSFGGKELATPCWLTSQAIALVENCFGIMMNVLEWNRPAIRFFRSRGIKFLDDWKTGCLDGETLRAAAMEH